MADQQQSDLQKAFTLDAIEDIPHGFIRWVHITARQTAEEILSTGLRNKHGMLSSTATPFSNHAQVTAHLEKASRDEFDSRFRFKNGMAAVFLDIPTDISRHFNSPFTPDIIDSRYIRAIAYPDKTLITKPPTDEHFISIQRQTLKKHGTPSTRLLDSTSPPSGTTAPEIW